MVKNLLNIIFFSFVIFAQDPNFTATVSNSTISIDERVQIDFVLENGGVNGGENFRAPSFNKFFVLTGPNQSTNMQFVNGKFSSSATYSFILQPKEIGKFTIASATIEASGKLYKTEPITINVVASGNQNQSLQKKEKIETEQSEIFLRASVDKENVFQGEQITVTYKIYTRYRITGYSINKLPAMVGFWEEEIKIPQQISLNREIVNGKQYQVGVIKKSALFPTKNGKLKINPFELNCQIQVQTRSRSNDPFDDFFNDPFFSQMTNKNVTLRSNEININVKSLPAENKPNNFYGLVGDYKLKVSSNTKEIKSNEPITLKAEISGIGNISLIESPKFEMGNEFEIFEPKITTSIDKSSNLISGKKNFEWLLIPRIHGRKTIPKIELTFFSPIKKKYEILKSSEIEINILQSANLSNSNNTLLNKEEIAILNEDINYIKENEINFSTDDGKNYKLKNILYFFVFPGIIFLGILFFILKNEKLKSNAKVYYSIRAIKIANSKLSEAKKILDKKSNEEFTTILSKIIWDYFSAKLSINRSDLSIEKIAESLLKREIKIEKINELKNILNDTEFAKFAPGDLKDTEYKNLYERTKLIIVEIESNLK